MKKVNKIAKYVFFPKMLLAIIFSLCAAALFVWQFIQDSPTKMISYTSYFLCAYSFVLFLIRLISVARKSSAIKKGNKYVRQFFSDTFARVRFTLYYSIFLNLVFAGLQIYLGIKNDSEWLSVLGIYYGFLVLVRIVLLFETNKMKRAENLYSEHKSCRFCGALLCLMDVSVTYVMYHIAEKGEGFEYNFFITALMAIYAFCILTFTIMNLVRCGKYKSPIVSTAEWVNLAEALMCVMFLETSLIALLGKSEDYIFRRSVTTATGIGISLFVFFVSLWIIIKNSIDMKKIKKAKNI